MIFKEAVIFLNNICNFNCYHCYVKKGKKELSFSDLSFFIDNHIPKYNIQRISLVGGEPFLYNKLVPLLKKLSYLKNLEITLTTNGSIYSDKFIEPLKSINLKLLKISLQSLKIDVFSKFTGTKNQFQNVLENINKFLKDFNIGINITITELNYKELDKIIYFCQEKGIKYLQISQLTPSGKGAVIKDEKLKHNIVESIQKELKKYSNNNINISYDDSSFCSFGRKLILNPDGDIYPCPALISFPQYKIGNIHSSDQELSLKIKKFSMQRKEKCFIEEFIL